MMNVKYWEKQISKARREIRNAQCQEQREELEDFIFHARAKISEIEDAEPEPRKFSKKGQKQRIKRVRRDLAFAQDNLHLDHMNCSCSRCQKWHFQVLALESELACLLEEQVSDGES